MLRIARLTQSVWPTRLSLLDVVSAAWTWNTSFASASGAGFVIDSNSRRTNSRAKLFELLRRRTVEVSLSLPGAR